MQAGTLKAKWRRRWQLLIAVLRWWQAELRVRMVVVRCCYAISSRGLSEELQAAMTQARRAKEDLQQMSEGMRAVLLKLGRAKACGLMFLMVLPTAWLAIGWLGLYLIGADRLGYLPKILASVGLASAAAWAMEWIFETRLEGPERGEE